MILNLILILIRLLPSLWVGWTLKTFVSWYYPHNKHLAANPGDTVLTWVLWTGVACLVVAIGQGYAPDGSISKGIAAVQLFVFRIFRTSARITAMKWKEADPDATPPTV